MAVELDQGTVGRCIDTKSEDAASVPIKMFRGRPRTDSVTEITDHAFLELLDYPCPDIPSRLFRQKVYADLASTGDYFGHIGRGPNGLPASITRLRPDEMTPKADPTGARTIGQYLWDPQEKGPYSLLLGGGRDIIKIPWQDVCHVKRRHPFTDLRGYGDIQRLRHEILMDGAMRDFDWSRWSRGLPTEYILFWNGKLTKGEREELLNTLRRKYAGPKGENFMLVETTEAGQKQMEVKDFPRHTEQELAMLDREQRLVYRICSAFGVPPSKLQDYSQSTRIANADAMDRQYWEDTIVGMHVLFEDYMNSHFIPLNYGRGMFIAHDYSEVRELQQAAKEVAEIQQIYVTNGIITRNEARVKLNLKPLPNPFMDEPMVGNLPLGAIPFLPDATMPMNDDDDDDDDDERDDDKGKIVPLRRKMLLQEPLLDLDEEKQIFDRLVRAKLKTIMRRAGDQHLDVHGIQGSFDVTDPTVLNRLERMTVRMSSDVVINTDSMVRARIAESITDGLAIPDMRDSIQTAFKVRREPWQLDRISRTEVHQAQEGGAYEASLQHGVEFKVWVTARDQDVRGLNPDDVADHDAMEAMGPLPMEVAFIDPRSGARMMFPGDRDGAMSGADTINCRCTWAADFSHLEGAGKPTRAKGKDDVWYAKAERRAIFEADMNRTLKRYLIGMEKRALAEFDRQTRRAADTGAVAAN